MEYQIPFVMKEHLNNILRTFYLHRISAVIFTFHRGNIAGNIFLQIANRPNRFFSRDSMKGGTVTYDSLREYYRDKNWMTDRVDQLEWDMKMIKDQKHHMQQSNISGNIWVMMSFLKDYAEYRKISVEDHFCGAGRDMAEFQRI